MNLFALPESTDIDDNIDNFLKTPIDSRSTDTNTDFTNRQTNSAIANTRAPPQKTIVNTVNFDWESSICKITKKIIPKTPKSSKRVVSGLPDIARREKEKDEEHRIKYTLEHVIEERPEVQIVFPLRKNEKPNLRHFPELVPKRKKVRRFD